jgi:AGCS family alanine or glycine:cation symporter
MVSGVVMTLIVGLVIVGGIKRIGNVTGRLVPFMCLSYLVAGLAVLAVNIEQIPGLLRLIVSEAFTPSEAQGAFLGGAAGFAFLKGMQRSLFSSEAGQGSSPIAHSAAKTDEPVREGIVAGLEPFIDTLVVCTITALVILSSGTWNRDPDVAFASPPAVLAAEDGGWTLEPLSVPGVDEPISTGQPVFAIVSAHDNEDAGTTRHQLMGSATPEEDGSLSIGWETLQSEVEPTLISAGLYFDYKGATLTAKAFDHTWQDLGKWLVTMAAWLFAISTMISWSYYGEQGIVYLMGTRAVMPYRVAFCLLILVATSPLIRTEHELDVISVLGTGVMLAVNIPLMLIFGRQAMTAYKTYFRRLDDGSMRGHDTPRLTDVVEGRDVE